MKIKIKKAAYEEVLAIPSKPHRKPLKTRFVFRFLLKILSIWDLRSTHFTHREIHMEKLKKGEPCLVLMNHSSFIDLKIAAALLYSHKKVCDGYGVGARYDVCRKKAEKLRADVSGGKLQL